MSVAQAYTKETDPNVGIAGPGQQGQTVNDAAVEVLGQAQSPAIVLVMIVRNESSNILRCLSSVMDSIHGAVIVDTGSTDDTMQLVRSFFDVMQNIPLVLEQRPWRNFGHNRNEAMRLAETLVRTHNAYRSRRDVYFLLLDADMELDGTIDPSEFRDDCYTIMQKQLQYSVPGTRLLRHFGPASGRHWKCFGVTHEAWCVVADLDIKDSETAMASIAQPQCLMLFGISILDHDDGGCKSDKFARDIELLEQYLEFENPNDTRAMLFLGMSYVNLGIRKHAEEQARKKEIELIETEMLRANPVREGSTVKGNKLIREWRSPLDPRKGNRIRLEIPQSILDKQQREQAVATSSTDDTSSPPLASALPGHVAPNYAEQLVREYSEEEFIQLFGVDAAKNAIELEKVVALLKSPDSTTNESPTAVSDAASPQTTGTIEQAPAFSFAESIQSCAQEQVAAQNIAALPDNPDSVLPALVQQPTVVNTSESEDKTNKASPDIGIQSFQQKLSALSAKALLGKSIEWLLVRLENGKIEKDPNNEEVWYAKLLFGKVCLVLEHVESAMFAFMEAYNMRPHRNESLIHLSKLCREKQMLTAASRFADIARRQTNTGTDVLFLENNAYLIDPWLESLQCVVGKDNAAALKRTQYLDYLVRRPYMQANSIDPDDRLAFIANTLQSVCPDLPLTLVPKGPEQEQHQTSNTSFAVTCVWPTITLYYDGELVSNIPTMANWYLQSWFLWPDCKRTSDGTTAWLVITERDCIRFVDCIVFVQGATPTMTAIRRVSIPYKLPNKGDELTTSYSFDEATNSIQLFTNDTTLATYRVSLDELCFDDCSASDDSKA